MKEIHAEDLPIHEKAHELFDKMSKAEKLWNEKLREYQQGGRSCEDVETYVDDFINKYNEWDIYFRANLSTLLAGAIK